MVIKTVVKQSSLLTLLFSISIFISMVPYFLQGNEWIIRIFFLIGLASGFLLVKRKIDILNYYVGLIFFVMMVLIYLPRHEASPMFNYNLLLVLPFIFMDQEYSVKAFRIFTKIFAIFLLPAVVVNILLYFNVNIPYEQSEYTVENKLAAGYFYIERYGSILIGPDALETRFPRLIGFLDEPGYTATLIFFILLGHNFNLKKWYNIILFLGGLMTLSLAFIILLLIYLFFRASIKVKIISAISILSLVYLLKESNYQAYFEESTLERLEEFIAGQDNRIGNDIYYAEITKQSKEFSFRSLFGRGYNSVKTIKNVDVGTGTLHWTYWFLDFGYIGMLLIVLFYVFITNYYNKTIAGWFFLAMFLLSVYQRPLIFHSFYFFILIGGLINIKYSSLFRESVD